MAASYSALASLINIIHEIEHHHSPPISLDNQQAQSLTENVTFLLKFLESYDNNTPVADIDEADPLEIRIADAAYAAEDAIESHIVYNIKSAGTDYADSIFTRFFNCSRGPKRSDADLYQSLQRVIDEIDSIKRATTHVEVHDQQQKNVPAPLSSSTGHKGTMVGCDDVLLQAMEKLTGGRPNRQVFSIVGAGGIGKTTLARSIYTHPVIVDHFPFRAWATISQQYNTRETLCEVYSQLTNIIKEELSEMSEDVLRTELHKYLFGRMFLVVMDDMCSIDAWDEIQNAFPNNDNGSRILVTTRLSNLSSQLNENYNLEMSFLDKVSSWELFSKIVFGEENRCPIELEKIGEKIVDQCRGLPLSIVVVGGILRKTDNTKRRWELILNNLTSLVNLDNDKHCLRLFKLSYNHLPVYLKPCFLYMGVFEEDDEIKVSTLVKLWILEGFLKPTNGESLESVAKGYFKDLVDRNLILIHESGPIGNIKSCKIHDLLRDLCLREGTKDGFYHVIGQCNPRGINSQRRVVVPKNTSNKKLLKDLRSMSHARSLICGDGEAPLRRNLELLRTLHAYNYGYYEENFLTNSVAFQYFNLRHLAIEVDSKSSFLASMSRFWNLHTVIISCSSKSTVLDGIWKMPQFRHVEFTPNHLCLPDPPPSDGRGDVVVIMANLRTLKGVKNFNCCEEVVERIPNLRKLGIQYGNDGYYSPSNIKFLSKLRSLEVESCYKSIGSLITFPHSLKKLKLCFKINFKWEDMLHKIGSLPVLEKLEMQYGCFGTRNWEIVEGQFPCLKYLGLNSCGGLEHWTTEESSVFPCLETLTLRGLESLERIPSEVGNIPTLRKIELTECSEAAVKSAKEIVDEQVELQGERLSFLVTVSIWTKNKELLSLATPNFQMS